MKKIDAHSHFGNFGGWAGVENSLEELLSHMDEYNIEKTLLTGRDSYDNEELNKVYQANKERIIPIVFINPTEKNHIEEARKYIVEKGFKGIKLHPLMHAYVADDQIVYPIMELAEELDVPVFIHSGHPPYSLPWSIALLAEKFQNVDVIMVHMGHGHGVYIDAAIEMAKRYENIYLEMSGMPMNMKIKQAYKEVGSDRIFFGIDAPFHHPTIEIQKVLTSGLKEKEQKDVFYNNISKLMDR